jgi:lycopene beta-cyclase
MTRPPFDIAVLGSGPSGLALAAACAEQGLSVCVIAPDPSAAWTANYGSWIHDLPTGTPTAQCWDTVTVTAGRGRRVIEGAYAAIDKQALQASLLGRFASRGGLMRPGTVPQSFRPSPGALIPVDDGTTVAAHLVVDARGAPTATAWQVARGMLVRVDGHPWAPGTMALMDFSAEHLAHGEDDLASFLYALPMAPDVVFVEETSLAARPPVSMDLLERRLQARLQHLGIRVVEVLENEQCRIPMNAPIPDRGPMLPFGARAGMVHPATGYQLSHALRTAPHVAQAITESWSQGPSIALERAWDALWPTAMRRTRALHDLGLELLLHLTPSETRTFFNLFFDLPEHERRAYLSQSSSPSEVARAMSRLFLRMPWHLRTTTLRQAVGPGRTDLFRVLHPSHRGAL